MNMDFEFDKNKSAINKEKHKIDFAEAQVLWDDPDRLEIPAITSDEERRLVIGKIGKKVWSAIITYRENKTRIISVRRSRDKEAMLYES